MSSRHTQTKPCPGGCGKTIDPRAKTCFACRYRDGGAVRTATPEEQHLFDRERRRFESEITTLKDRYKHSLKTIEQQEAELQVVSALKDGLETYTIEPVAPSGTSEATVIAVASDWHIEERIGREVGGLNTYSLDIAKYRIERFFTKALRLTNLLANDIRIDTMVLALLGDYITGNIHGEENAETNALQPIHAIVLAQKFIVSGIQYILDNSDLKLVIPCHSGNHARTTLKTRFSAENGHSLEYFMFLSLADHFRDDPRVTFIIPEAPHSYMQIYDMTVRFQHGHMVKYGGGVGGLYIPVHKAIAQWNKARHADLDIFGHFHMARDGGNFICNGSIIGYNGFALSIKADYEDPKQQLVLIDKKRGRTCLWPILVK